MGREHIEKMLSYANHLGLFLLARTPATAPKIIAEPRAPQLLKMACKNYINKECERAYSDASNTTHFQQYVLFIFVYFKIAKVLSKNFCYC